MTKKAGLTGQCVQALAGASHTKRDWNERAEGAEPCPAPGLIQPGSDPPSWPLSVLTPGMCAPSIFLLRASQQCPAVPTASAQQGKAKRQSLALAAFQVNLPNSMNKAKMFLLQAKPKSGISTISVQYLNHRNKGSSKCRVNLGPAAHSILRQSGSIGQFSSSLCPVPGLCEHRHFHSAVFTKSQVLMTMICFSEVKLDGRKFPALC